MLIMYNLLLKLCLHIGAMNVNFRFCFSVGLYFMGRVYII